MANPGSSGTARVGLPSAASVLFTRELSTVIDQVEHGAATGMEIRSGIAPDASLLKST
jgi:hypothetical protein